jgi:GNAT superfamily N-acetyltransferase
MVEVRDAERADVRLLKQLIDEMGGHERMIVSVTEDSLAMDSFGPKPQFRALIAEADRRVAGYALFFDCYSSFQGRGIFLEDLFVRDEFRGKRVGAALLSRVAEIAVELDCVGIMLNVLDWNESARRFFVWQVSHCEKLPVRNLLPQRAEDHLTGNTKDRLCFQEEAMAGIEKVATLTIAVEDQDKALEWFTEKLGFEKRTDLSTPGMR